MDKTRALLLVMATAGCMAVPIAYFAGQIHTEGTLRLEIESELSTIRIDHANAMAELRQEIGMLHMEQEKMSAAIRDDLENAGISVSEWDPEPPPPEPETITAAITQAQLDQLTLGITYEDAVRILHKQGELVLDMDDDSGISTKVYRWTWDNVDGRSDSISVTFADNKLTETGEPRGSIE